MTDIPPFSRSRIGPRVLVVLSELCSCTRGCLEGVGGFPLSIKIVFLGLGGPSSREIAKFGDPPRNFVDFCSVICLSSLAFQGLGRPISRENA